MTTRSTVVAAGGAGPFSVPFPYLSRSHVKVAVNGVLTTAFSWLTASSIEFDEDLVDGDEVLIYRETPEDALVSYTGGAVLPKADLQMDSLQALYRVEEVDERAQRALVLPEITAGGYDADGKKIVGIADGSDATDAASYGQLLEAIQTAVADPNEALVLQVGAGAVGRTVQAKLRERPSVLDYIDTDEHAAIAAGTSTLDCTAAFAAALAAHDHVFVPPGEYWVSQIVMDDHQSLVGYGWGVSAIKQIASTDAPLVRNADQVNGNINISLIQLRLDGNKAAQTLGSNARGIYFVACAGVYMQGVWVYNCRDHGCMSSGDATNWTVIGCRFTDCGSEAHITAGGAGGTGLLCAKKSVVVGCRGARNYLNGFKSSGDNLTYIGCVAEDNNGGFDTGTVGGLTNRHMRFISCAAVSNDGYGFAFGPQTSHIEMHACNASENGKAGVYILQNVVTVKIIGGYFMNNGQSGSVGSWPDDQTRLDGIAITDSGSTNYATDIEIRGVTCTDNQAVKTQEYGIFTRGGPEGVRIIDCDLRNNKTGAILNLHEKVMEVRGCLGVNTDPSPNLAGTTVTGTTSSTQLLASTVKEDEMHAGAVLRLAASGTVTGTAGTKLIRIVTGSTSQIACNFAAGETGSWSVDAEIVFNSRSSQTWKVTASKAGVTTTSVYSVSMNFTTADRLLAISGQLGNAADSIVCNQASIASLR